MAAYFRIEIKLDLRRFDFFRTNLKSEMIMFLPLGRRASGLHSNEDRWNEKTRNIDFISYFLRNIENMRF
jgi:hypothetical protein